MRRMTATVSIALVCSVVPLQAQDTICSFTWNSNVACNAYIPCVTADSFNNQTFVVPSNVTRIGQTGLRVCLSDTSFNRPADIIYVVDFSGSMSVCQNPSGDPYYKRAEAVYAGYEYQRDSVPGSRFGYVSFASQIVTLANYGTYTFRYVTASNQCNSGPLQAIMGNNVLPPVATDLAAGRDSVERVWAYLNHDQHLYFTSLNYTNYYLPLARAMWWLRDPALSPNPNKAIIFITDGQPNRDEDKRPRIVDSLIQMGVPIYGIYLGASLGTNNTLVTISRQTGGYATLVPPTNTDTLATVVRNIVREINQFSFDTLTVTANGISANGVNAVKNVATGTWDLSLDGIVPLHPGANPVSFYARFESDTSAAGGKTIAFNFTIDVSGTPAPNCYNCRPKSTLAITNAGGTPLDSLNYQSTSYWLRLTYYGGIDLPATDVIVRTNKGDYEVVRLTNPASGPNGALIYTRQIPFAIVDQAAPLALNDGTTQALFSDTVRAAWVHPRDTNDRASDWVPVLAPPNRIAMYPAAGDPTAQTPYPTLPAVDTVAAGSTVPLYAKVFGNTTWLPTYETDPALAAAIMWTLREVGGTGTTAAASLSTAGGAASQLRPVQAYKRVDVIVSMYNGADTLRDTARFYIVPGPARSLAIESNPNRDFSPNAPPSPALDSVVIGSNVITAPPVYAILRDSLGNYIGPATAAVWSSFDTAVVAAAAGNSSLGEGIITRVSAGATRVRASQGLLSDTIGVVVREYYYTRLVIATESLADSLTALTLTTDADTTWLYAYGLRSDNGVWELVSQAAWGITDAALVTPGAPGASSVWPFVPAATGSGRIRATAAGATGVTVGDSITLTIVQGRPFDMVLYPAVGDPAAMTPLAEEVTIQAGVPQLIVAKLFDRLGLWIPQGETVDSLRYRIGWSLAVTGQPASAAYIDSTRGHLTTFVATAAHQTYTVTATYGNAGYQVVRSLRIKVIPAAASQITIEPSSNWQASPNAPAHFANDTISITSDESDATVYALLRDPYGNFVAFADPAAWSTADSAIATAASGPQTMLGEGVVTRVGPSGVTTVAVTQDSLRGTAPVRILEYYYRELQIFVRTPSGPVMLDSLYMNTNLDTTLFVMGRRSNDAFRWDTLMAEWQISSSLTNTIQGSAGTAALLVSPTDTGRGWIRATLGDDERTLPDTIGVVFTPGPITSVTMTVLTPAAQLIAGDTIVALVHIWNLDGPVPGDSCYSTVFQDPLGSSPDGTPPVVIDEGHVDTLNEWPATDVLSNACFHNGVDTVRFVLTYAPLDPDSLHHLYATVSGRTGDAPPLRLLPGPLDRLVLEYVNGMRVPDALTLYAEQNQSRVFMSRGYDRFGNRRGDENSNWSTTGTLHAASRLTNTPRLFYDAGLAMTNEAGYVIALAVDMSQGPRADSVYVTIVGPAIRLVQAVTADTNGNGYLDGVLLRFDRPIALPTDPDSLQALLARLGFDYGSVSWQALDIRVVADSTSPDSAVFFVTLREDTTSAPGQPQTGWTPFISLANWPEVRSIPVGQVAAADGAGPVVWQVIKYVEEGKPDRVVVIFSEPVRDSTGSEISLSTLPSQIFNVYRWNRATSSFELVSAVLDSLVGLVRVNGDTVIFEMVNGRDLVPGWYLNIKVPALVADNANVNEPVADNRLVPVTLRGSISLNLQALPNPARGDTRIAGPREFSAGYSPDARGLVQNGYGGIVTNFWISRPTEGTVKLTRAIYDLAGNLVVQSTEKDLLATAAAGGMDITSTRLSIDVYWNCYNAKGMPAAPGIYREIMYIDYSSAATKDPPPQYVNYGVIR